MANDNQGKLMLSKSLLISVLSLLVGLGLAGCGGSDTAAVTQAKLARDPEGNQPTTIFAQDDTFYFTAQLTNAPADTRVKAAWLATNLDGNNVNVSIDEAEIVSGDGLLQFKLANDEPWPVGVYQVELYLNDNLVHTIEFEVEATGLVAAPTAAPPEPSPTAISPEPSPAAASSEPSVTPTLVTSPAAISETVVTPSPESTANPTPAEPAESSTSDTLGANSPAASPRVLPVRPYRHPTGAFSFVAPEGWQILNEDSTSVRFGDGRSGIGSVFADIGAVYSEAQTQDFVDSFSRSFVQSLGANYRVLEQNNRPDGAVYLAVSYDAAEGAGDADFLFVQDGTYIFALYLFTSAYEPMRPTWDVILDSYEIDLQAAQTAVSMAPAAPAPSATAGPAPAPAPSTDRFAPLSGRSRLYLVNRSQAAVVLAINGIEHTIAAGGEQPVDLDAGRYPYTIAASGDSVNGAVEMQANQSWAILVDQDGSVYYAQQIHP